MYAERRRADRHAFGGAAEVIDAQSEKQVIGLTTDLGPFGCFVKAATCFPQGTQVKLRIMHGDLTFASLGKVIHTRPNEGMGIVFGPIEPGDQLVLTKWLRQASR